jgi:hypothetical protein
MFFIELIFKESSKNNSLIFFQIPKTNGGRML